MMGIKRQSPVIVVTTLVCLLGFSLGLAQMRWLPNGEREALAERPSPYRQWLAQEGVPIYEGFAIEDLQALELKLNKRLGVPAAYVLLEGTGNLVDAIVMEIPVGQSSNAERHIFEEQMMILSGEGETVIWQSDEKKHTVRWRKGSIFSPPLNAWHQHVNTGQQPVKFVTITFAPMVVDIYRDLDFVYNCPYDFTKRYNGQDNYFDPEISQDYPPANDHSLSIVNFVRNAFAIRLFASGQGVDDVCRHFVMSDNMMGIHIEEFPVGTYERAHWHGPGTSLLFMEGSGYTLMWPREFGKTPFADGKEDEITRIDWKWGSLIVPPLGWYHQHFNTGDRGARWVKLGTPPGNRIYHTTTGLWTGTSGALIRFSEEDSRVREIFAEDLKKHGGTMKMPPMKELIVLEAEAEKYYDRSKVPSTQWPPMRLPTHEHE